MSEIRFVSSTQRLNSPGTSGERIAEISGKKYFVPLFMGIPRRGSKWFYATNLR